MDGKPMIDYGKIESANKFYSDKGYERVEAPWWVSQEIMDLTKPEDQDQPSYFISENRKCLVASGEQSLLYMANKGRLPKGTYQTTTPCFRNESIGVLSKKCFIKTELMKTDQVDNASLLAMIEDAMEFFKMELWLADMTDEGLELVDTEDGFDIQYNKIEVGSYGIRECPFLKWIYGTGCAEPRFSRAIKSKGI